MMADDFNVGDAAGIEGWWEHHVPLTDLRSITRRSAECETTVTIVGPYDNFRHPWLRWGEANLRDFGGEGGRRKDVLLTAYLDNATDFEHDSAHALQLPLIGWTFDSMRYHAVRFSAWVLPTLDPSWDQFRVPGPGYNPLAHPETIDCDNENCIGPGGPHRIVPEGFYIAPHNPELYERVRGQQVLVTIRPERTRND